MSDLELRAYGQIAKAITQQAFAMAQADEKYLQHIYPDAPRPIYHHGFTSTFEGVADDLRRLQILKTLNEMNGPVYFVFDCEVDHSDLLAERNAALGPTFPELLVTFINLFGDNGSSWDFSSKPNTLFGIDSRIKPALDALAALGFLGRTNAGYIWTDLIAPIMRNSYEAEHWPEVM